MCVIKIAVLRKYCLHCHFGGNFNYSESNVAMQLDCDYSINSAVEYCSLILLGCERCAFACKQEKKLLEYKAGAII